MPDLRLKTCSLAKGNLKGPKPVIIIKSISIFFREFNLIPPVFITSKEVNFGKLLKQNLAHKKFYVNFIIYYFFFV